MVIQPKSVFLHGKVRFDPAKRYEVPPEVGFYAIAMNWAQAADGPADMTPTAGELGPEPLIGNAGGPLQPDDGTARPAS